MAPNVRDQESHAKNGQQGAGNEVSVVAEEFVTQVDAEETDYGHNVRFESRSLASHFP
jgi:hypothetical protein